MEGTTFDSMDAFCALDFDYNIHLGEVFLEHLIGEVALIPGLVLAAVLMDRFGRSRLISITRNYTMFNPTVLKLILYLLRRLIPPNV